MEIERFITVRVHFSAAHCLSNPKFSQEENRRIFGECANPNFHGHNYQLDVTLCGEPDPDTGMILDMKELKTIIQEKILDHVDHKNLNLDVPFLKGPVPTAENVASAFWKILDESLGGTLLYELTVHESGTNCATCRRKA